MKNRPLVSIILPVYNVQAYLETCIESLINQTYKDLEIIAINDGSTDQSLSILEAYAQKDSRLRVVSQENQGLSAARNTGLNVATGDYIIFIDSDDYIATDLVALCVTSFQKQEVDVLVYNHGVFQDGQNEIQPQVKALRPGRRTNGEYLNEVINLKTNTWNPVWLYAFTSNFLNQHRLKFHEGIYHEDILFTPTMLSFAKHIGVLPEVLYYYRIRPGSITTDASKLQKSLKDHIFIAAQLFQLSQKKAPSAMKASLEQLVAQRYQFILEAFERQQISFGHRDYDALVKTLQKKASITKQYAPVFYQKYIETPKQKRRREFLEAIWKWPRRIYKYQIKSRLK
jgi:glycosyltransferase involved in cell wall biosynthesis